MIKQFVYFALVLCTLQQYWRGNNYNNNWNQGYNRYPRSYYQPQRTYNYNYYNRYSSLDSEEQCRRYRINCSQQSSEENYGWRRNGNRNRNRNNRRSDSSDFYLNWGNFNIGW